MKRYIRTKDGKIFDLQAVNHSIRHAKNRKINNGDIEVIKQADTIEELVEVGDLVVGYGKSYLINDTIGGLFDVDMFEISEEAFNELYTKQGRNYVLVAEITYKEWRII